MRPRSVIFLTLVVVAACGDNGSSPADGGVDIDAAPTADAGPDATDVPDAAPDAMPEGPPPPPPPPKVTTCERTIAAPTAGICDATAGTGTAVVIRGNILADGDAFVNGEVVYDGDLIVCAGCDCSGAAGYATATQIDCAGAAVSPGLINAHDHLNYNTKAPLASTARGGTRFEHRHEWRALGNTPAPPSAETQPDRPIMRWNELRHALSGTTSLAASTQAYGMVRNLDELEADDEALGFREAGYEVFALGDGNRQFKANCTWSYARSEWQVMQLPALVTHTSEGINDYAHEEFRCQSTTLNGGRDLTGKNVAHIHGVGLTAADYETMVRDGTKLVWSPRSNVSLYANTAQAQVFKRLGGTIALGTDWSYSGSATLSREMACAAYLDDTHFGNAFSDEDIWRMATINGAAATGTADRLGSLAVGKIADIAVFRAAPEQLHRAVIDALTDDVALVVRDGDLLFAETDVATALGQSCDPIDVCGEERRVCASREFGGATFATIATAMGALTPPAYPAIFCDLPANEPTCVPSRAGSYDGPTEADPDGDGITTGDNCPTVFNPVRPMDKNGQPDADADGTGDPCDSTPLGRDFDRDGRDNTGDVCVLVADDGADGDTDGVGDRCDECPDQANIYGVCLPPVMSIPAVQAPLAANTKVELTGVVVTAVDSGGAYVQDPTIADGVKAGVYAFAGSRPTLQIGDRVTVAGYTTEYFTLTELAGSAFLSSEAATPIAPVAQTVTAARGEDFEGVLVTLARDAGTTVTPTYDCSADNTSCRDARLWKISGSADADDFIVVSDVAWRGTQAEWAEAIIRAQAGATVTGVMTIRFDRRRILPRTPADIP